MRKHLIFFITFVKLAFHGNILFASDLSVQIDGIRNSTGVVRVALFNNVADFPTGQEFKSSDVKAKVGSVVVLFNELDPGFYAVAVHHDENKDGEMNTNFIGLPKEGYGFSNNAKVFLSPPYFESAAFKMTKENKTVSLSIIY